LSILSREYLNAVVDIINSSSVPSLLVAYSIPMDEMLLEKKKKNNEMPVGEFGILCFNGIAIPSQREGTTPQHTITSASVFNTGTDCFFLKKMKKYIK